MNENNKRKKQGTAAEPHAAIKAFRLVPHWIAWRVFRVQQEHKAEAIHENAFL